MNLGRRRFLFKAGVTAAGAGTGYAVGRFAFGLDGGLDAAVNGFYNVTHDTLTEITGVAEKRLRASAQEVKSYLTSIERDHASVQKYWEDIGLLTGKESGELQQILAKVEQYTQESDLRERLTRLRDRLEKRLVDGGSYLEGKQPEGLRKFNEWLSKKIQGEDKGSRAALEKYRERLGYLINVYDINKDNKIAQAELLDQTSGYFVQTQQEVVKKISEYLVQNTFGSSEERDFFVQLKQVADADPSGRKLADYLLNAGNYFTLLETSSQVHQLKDKLGKTLDDIVHLQEALDKGIELKNTLRAASDHDLAALRKQTTELEAYMAAKKQELEQQGYKIDYELFPKMKALRDNILDGIDQLRGIGGALGVVAGATVAYLAIDRATRPLTRRQLLTLQGEQATWKEKCTNLEGAIKTYDAENAELRRQLAEKEEEERKLYEQLEGTIEGGDEQ